MTKKVVEIDKSKKLKVLAAVLKRALLELDMYKDEVVNYEKEIECMGSQHDKFRQINMALGESKDMSRDAMNRILVAKNDLCSFLDENVVDENEDICKDARSLLLTAEKV